MSQISVDCPVCHQQLSIPEHLAGTMILCPQCEFQWLVPGGRSLPAATMPAPGASPAKAKSKKRRKSAPAEPDTRIRATPPGHALSQGNDDAEASSVADAIPKARPRRSVEPFEFRVRVRNDSHDLLRGTLRARITREGLTLQQGRVEELVPVGIKSRYLRKNQLYVDLETRRLQMLVVPFGCYANRLAHDLAGYLGGKKRTLRRRDYILPWYLYAAAFLPAGMPGIPFAGTAGGDLGTRTMTEAVIGGFTGMLIAGSVFVLQHDKWSLPLRLAVIAALSGLGYGAVFLYAAFVVWGAPESVKP